MLNHDFYQNTKKSKKFYDYYMKRVAAIDVGSNAIRLTIAEVISPDHYKIIEKFRFPIRLGTDVFQSGEVSLSKVQDLLEIFRNMKNYVDHFFVQDIRAVATSALRDAKNCQEIMLAIEDVSRIKLNLITGAEEAHYLFNILAHELPIMTGNVLLIDIGGGSTEIIFIVDGIIKKIESFNVGTIRMLSKQTHDLDKLIALVKTQVSHLNYKVIGTGGNLRRMGKLRKKIFNRTDVTIIHKNEVNEMLNHLSQYNPLQLMKKYDLKHDRAEVITPALQILSSIVNELNVDIINLPKVGLSDALILEMSSPKQFSLFQ